MTVGELKRMLERYPDEATVEFEDRSLNRVCPTNSSYVTKRGSMTVIRICNTLGQHRA